jgi:hypothetical protein
MEGELMSQNCPYLGPFSATQKASQKGEAKNGLFSQLKMSRMWMVFRPVMTLFLNALNADRTKRAGNSGTLFANTSGRARCNLPNFPYCHSRPGSAS